MTYTAQQIADYILYYAREKKISVTNLKLQKLLYFLWIAYYKKTGKPLFNDPMKAWKFGPVVPALYHKYRIFGGYQIYFDDAKYFEKAKSLISDEDKPILNQALDELLKFDANKLVSMSHEDGKPWANVFRHGHGLNDDIPFEMIIKLECNK